MSLIIPTEEELSSFASAPECAFSVLKESCISTPDKLQTVSKAGFNLVELGAGRGEVADSTKFYRKSTSELSSSIHDNDLRVIALRSDVELGNRSSAALSEAKDKLKSLLEIGNSLEGKQLIVRTNNNLAPETSAGYALDLLYSLESLIHKSGVNISIESGGSPESFLFDASGYKRFYKDVPENIGLTLTDFDTPFIKDKGSSEQLKLSSFARLNAHEIRGGNVSLLDSERSKYLLNALSSSGCGVPVSVSAELDSVLLKTLKSLNRQINSFLPESMMGH
jgi:hypothetical protein